MEIISCLPWQHVAVTTLIYVASFVFYRLVLHPLARFPGPKLAALTRYYEGYYDLVCNGQYTFKIAELHKIYGPIVRISPYELHVSDPAFFEKLYNNDGRWNKYDWSYDAFSAKPSMICSIDHDIHKARRAPLNSFFSKANVANKQDIIQRLSSKLCDRISEFSDTKTTINLGTAISAFTRDVATEFILGKSYDNLDMTDFNAGMTGVLQSSGAIWRLTKHVRWFGPLMKSLPLAFVEKMADDGTKAFFTFLKDTMRITSETICPPPSAAIDDKAPPRTIIHEILESSLPPTEKTSDRINDEVSTITGAAFETSAATLRLILYYVYGDAKILRRLRAELATATKGHNTTNTADLDVAAFEQLPYLTAVIMEGLRLSPGIATRMARIAPDRDLEYREWRIPAGTPVGMTTLLMHTDEQIYPEPKSFEPERWIDMDVRRKANKTYAPFARGTRICLGMHLAWAEMYIVLAALVQRFDLQFDGAGPKDVECASDQFIIGTEDQSGIKAFITQYRA
ncbi:N-acetyltryptophan 6-hydroxylase ivoC [Cladobotryum mycophilum]|uniref:N-acetyltryptophan 6-hydroxylase ivoC n=1 Tax=Cladobotryum mycophilum TaxID=491253 RepID=A0ABR0SJS2_9HYPO